jgi:methyl-accepting chemotaxis protein
MSARALEAGTPLAKSHLYRKIVFMGWSAIIASAAIIAYFDLNMGDSGLASRTSEWSLAVNTLVPYLIAALISAITAIGVMTIWPSTRVVGEARELVRSLNEIYSGDLTSRVRLKGDDPLTEVGSALNESTSRLAKDISQWKLINRRQWGALCRIRQAVESGQTQQALVHVVEMEKNWDRIAEIENRLIV